MVILLVWLLLVILTGILLVWTLKEVEIDVSDPGGDVLGADMEGDSGGPLKKEGSKNLIGVGMGDETGPSGLGEVFASHWKVGAWYAKNRAKNPSSKSLFFAERGMALGV